MMVAKKDLEVAGLAQTVCLRPGVLEVTRHLVLSPFAPTRSLLVVQHDGPIAVYGVDTCTKGKRVGGTHSVSLPRGTNDTSRPAVVTLTCAKHIL